LERDREISCHNQTETLPNLTQGAGNRLGRQVFHARDPKRRPFRNRGDMRYSRKEAAGEKQTDGARDHSGSSIFAIIFSAACRRSSMNCSTAASLISLLPSSMVTPVVKMANPDPPAPAGQIIPLHPGTKCECLIRAEAIEYLTPLYAAAEWNPDFQTAPFIDRNVLCQYYSEAAFQKIVKSFLLGTVMKYRHCTVTASALIAVFYANPGDEPVSAAEGRATVAYGQLRDVDLCILYLVTDPPNRHYGAVLTSLLQERNRYHRPTWIYTPNPIASATFQTLYGAAFAAVLDTPELNLLHVTPTERSQDPGRQQRRTPSAAAHDDVPQNQPRRAKDFSSSRQG
jgi:hypothetical protein